MRAYGLWIQNDKLIDTDTQPPDIVVINKSIVYDINITTANNGIGIKEIEILGLDLDIIPDSTYDDKGNLIQVHNPKIVR
jgi:hypothetical protein